MLQGREPFVSHEGLEQLHRFLFVLGITHVLYSCIAVGLAMTKVQCPPLFPAVKIESFIINGSDLTLVKYQLFINAQTYKCTYTDLSES